MTNLRTQQVKHADESFHVHYYTHWDGLLSCEGGETVTLSEYEAERLNQGNGFYR